ncbi:MAG: NADPH-dependent 7-cyano-7-deazaguanine reductase QueF [Pseudomonadales bacterium]|nr:NADPH-dependent 7-cyano-7-deazaguanine reductase QueF [Pseudomonadales bacterium]MCP5171939.1 NADPH-dependent 7-cyano-7-deazaguanine reductase QueF [Pseudomonadales bacterium]
MTQPYNPLGRRTEYPKKYDSGLLFAISRQRGRDALSLSSKDLPFYGFDLWTAFEVSWLDRGGKPVVKIAEFSLPCNTDHIVESKSLKLYLNSLNQQRFESPSKVAAVLEEDLSTCVNGPVMVDLYTLDNYARQGLQVMPGHCLDNLDVKVDTYQPDASLLRLDDGGIVSESLYSHLLKTNCPVTGQPDWASVLVKYTGSPINRESLLAYLISYRDHQDFHEQCVERIFMEILEVCQPRELEVCARYTRRGGIDINPYRSTSMREPIKLRVSRQ